MTRRDRSVEERRLGAVHLAPRVTANRDQSVRTVPLIAEVLVALQTAEVVQDSAKLQPGLPNAAQPS